ncbi:hypothetical protein LF95_12560 [Thalassospira sp. TSL5-1]|nr:hypothetical protein LF95_12560 [Thalassospira sp. TSL5-1]
MIDTFLRVFIGFLLLCWRDTGLANVHSIVCTDFDRRKGLLPLSPAKPAALAQPDWNFHA